VKLLRLSVLVVLCFMLPAFAPRAEAVSTKKVLIGVGLMAAGVALTAAAVDRCLFKDCGNAQATAGLVMFGVGTGVLIWGLASHSKNISGFGQLIDKQRQSRVLYGLSPRKNGLQGSLIVRW